jgi:rhodanese-related sulfurtransferase
MRVLFLLILAWHGFMADWVHANDALDSVPYVPLAKGKPYIHVVHDGRSIKVQRIQKPDYELHGYFARSVHECPPYCLQPVSPYPGVRLVGEMELFEFMETDLRKGSGLLVDTRSAAWFDKGTIPGSINLPFTAFHSSNGYAQTKALLARLGVYPRPEPDWLDHLLQYVSLGQGEPYNAKWNFEQAKKLVLWCNGPACGQSPQAIRYLAAMGYPIDKLGYYRGGMQMWQFWGLATVVSGGAGNDGGR